MRQIILAILLILFVGFAGATNPTPTYNMGHQGGDKFPGVIQMSYGTVDNDLSVGGNAAVAGTLTTGATISTGSIGVTALMAANKFFGAATGAGAFSWGNSTGAFTTSSGLNTFKGITWFGGSTNNFYGPVLVGGRLTAASFAVNTTSGFNGLVKANAGIDTPTDVAANVGGALAAKSLTVNTTSAFTGVATFTRPVASPVSTTELTGSTTISATTDKSFYPIDASGANATLILPVATSNAGRTYTVEASSDPGSYYVRITATSGSIIRVQGQAGSGGRPYLVSTDTAPFVSLTSDGTIYWARTTGTWLQHA